MLKHYVSSLQVEQRRREQWEEQQRLEQEEAELREGLRLEEEELRLETERMTRSGYEERVRASLTLSFSLYMKF